MSDTSARNEPSGWTGGSPAPRARARRRASRLRVREAAEAVARDQPRVDGLELFQTELNPAALAEVRQWIAHPDLRPLLWNLQAKTERKTFFDSWAEAMVARHLLRHGCALRFEVPTPLGKRADFEVTADGVVFHLHLKRVDTDRPSHSAARMIRMSSRLRVLERVPRSYVVQVRWREEATDDQMQRLVTQAAQFILHARVGDELVVRDEGGREIGGVRIVAPWTGNHVTVTIGLPSGFVDHAPRIRRLMHRAYQQFMPRSANVIMVCSGHPHDRMDFENALLGSHIERWDAYPPRGKRVAHGRAADGFWHGGRFAESRLAAWCWFDPLQQGIHSHLWMRKGLADDLDPAHLAAIRRVLETEIR